jgi:hypothetical protein
VILMTGCNGWEAGLDVVVEGDAVPVSAQDTLQRLARAWAEKWDGRWRYEARDGALHTDRGAALVFSVTPSRALAFGKGTFSHMQYRD